MGWKSAHELESFYMPQLAQLGNLELFGLQQG
jgi:hypothetical protein